MSGDFGAVFRLLNLRYARERPRRLLLTVGGLAVGIALVVSTLLVNATLRDAITASASGIAGDADLEVTSRSPAGLAADTPRRLASLPGVAEAVPLTRSVTQLESGQRTLRAPVLGVPRNFRKLFSAQVRSPGLSNAMRRSTGVWLSQELAQDLDARPGQLVHLKTPRGGVRVRVGGIVDDAPFQAFNNGVFAMLSRSAADAYFDRRRRADFVFIKARHGVDVSELRRSAESALRYGALVGPPGSSAQAYQRTFDSIAQLSSAASLAALVVALLVVGNTMSMALVERRRVIATTLALGGRAREVIAAFLAEAVLLGTLAVPLGVAGGLLMAHLLVPVAVADFRFLPVTAGGGVHLTAPIVIAAFFLGTVVSLASSLVPARRIARMRPIEPLRLTPSASYETTSDKHNQPAGRRWALRCGVALAVAAMLVAVASAWAASQWIEVAAAVVGLLAAALLLPAGIRAAIRALVVVIGRGRRGTNWRLAAGGLAQQPGRTMTAVIALGIAGALVVAVGSAIDSFEKHIDSSASKWFGAPLYVDSDSYYGLRSDQSLPADLRAPLEAAAGVRGAYPWRYAAIDRSGQQLVIYALPIAEAAADGASDMFKQPGVQQAAMERDLAAGDVMVSRFTATRLGLARGDTIMLPTPKGSRAFTVAALFDDLVSFDSLYMEQSRYAQLWGDRTVDRFAIMPQRGIPLGEVAQNLKRQIAREQVPAEVLTRDEVVDKTFALIRGTFSLARALQFVALLVAGLVVANIMLTSVLDRRWEFGLTRALGVTPMGLGIRVAAESLLIGFLGALAAVCIGALLGLLMVLSLNIEFAWAIGFAPKLTTLLVAVVVTVLVASLSGTYASWRAARVPLTHALRLD